MKKDNILVNVYSLIDPETLEVRYIGITVNLKYRQLSNFSEKHNPEKIAWVNSLKQKGLLPIMNILEKVPFCFGKYVETKYICESIAKGYKLFNKNQTNYLQTINTPFEMNLHIRALVDEICYKQGKQRFEVLNDILADHFNIKIPKVKYAK